MNGLLPGGREAKPGGGQTNRSVSMSAAPQRSMLAPAAVKNPRNGAPAMRSQELLAEPWFGTPRSIIAHVSRTACVERSWRLLPIPLAWWVEMRRAMASAVVAE